LGKKERAMPDNTDIDPDGPEEDAAADVYDPDEVEVTRGRQQGLGVGARDLKLQQDRQPSVSGADVEGGGEADDAPTSAIGAPDDKPGID
jgi:hypothetical protein